MTDPSPVHKSAEVGRTGVKANVDTRERSATQSRNHLFYFPIPTKDQIEAAKGIAEIVALVLAGYWFLMRGGASNRVNLSSHVESHKITPNLAWISCDVEISNVGEKEVDIIQETVRLQQVLPLDGILQEQLASGKPLVKNGDPHTGDGEAQAGWPMLAKKELHNEVLIRSGETQQLSWDFQVPKETKLIRIYFRLTDRTGAKFGWDHSIIHTVNWND